MVVDVLYLQGRLMPADGISRGRSLSETDVATAGRMAAAIRALYSGWKAFRILGGGAGARIFRRSSPNTHEIQTLF